MKTFPFGKFGARYLVRAGRSELMKLIYGAVKPAAGHIVLKGSRRQFKTPRDAVRAGVALCPEDRKQEGIVAIASAPRSWPQPIPDYAPSSQFAGTLKEVCNG